MATESTPQSLLQQLAQIQHMDRGSVALFAKAPEGLTTTTNATNKAGTFRGTFRADRFPR